MSQVDKERILLESTTITNLVELHVMDVVLNLVDFRVPINVHRTRPTIRVLLLLGGMVLLPLLPLCGPTQFLGPNTENLGFPRLGFVWPLDKDFASRLDLIEREGVGG